MTIDTQLTELIINTLSPEQMPAQPSETEIYLVEDDAEYATVEELATKQNLLTAGDNITIENDVISAKASGGLEVGDIGLSIFVDESKGLRRYLNGSIVAINDNTQAFLDRLKQVVALYPSIACTESEWQSIKTMSVFGQCGKFVIDEANGAIRLPRIVMPIQGLTDLTKLGEIVEQGLPNINSTGTASIASLSNIPITTPTGALQVTRSDTTWSRAGGNTTGYYFYMNFDASRSSSIYKDGSNVQQEQIQYPYFIQIATGQETVVDIVNEIELNNPYSLFDCKFADHLLNNASWLRADTFSWYDGDIYVDAYNELLSEYNEWMQTHNPNTDYIGEGGVNFYRTAKGYKIVPYTSDYTIGEQQVIDKYNTDGIAWFYILDTANKRFKLPRTKWGFKGVRDVVGNPIDEKLPNIKGNIASRGVTGDYSGAVVWSSGAFAHTRHGSTAGGSTITVGSSTVQADSNDFNASRSSSTYQDNAPVQERATQMYLYFYVGETVQNANLIDAGRIAEQLTNKVDVDSSWGFPSNRYVDLTLGANGSSYTAPANGWFSVGGNDLETGNNFKYVMRIESTRFGVSSTNPSGTTGWLAGVLPVKKGDTVNIYYYGLTSTGVFLKFFYAEGAK